MTDKGTLILYQFKNTEIPSLRKMVSKPLNLHLAQCVIVLALSLSISLAAQTLFQSVQTYMKLYLLL